MHQQIYRIRIGDFLVAVQIAGNVFAHKHCGIHGVALTSGNNILIPSAKLVIIARRRRGCRISGRCNGITIMYCIFLDYRSIFILENNCVINIFYCINCGIGCIACTVDYSFIPTCESIGIGLICCPCRITGGSYFITIVVCFGRQYRSIPILKCHSIVNIGCRVCCSMHNDPSEWQIFKNTHEAIVDEAVFEIVQKIRNGRRKVTPLGEMPILSGMLFCADCGAKLYQVRGRGWEHSKEYFVCATYRKIKGGCSSHQIRNVVIEEALLDDIRRVTAFAKDHEAEFLQMVTSKTKIALDRSLRENKRELEQATQRIRKLDEIIQRLYEDNLEGKISDDRFAKMTANYEAEQHSLEQRVAELRTAISSEKETALNADHFLSLVHKYTEIPELTAEIIREFVEKVYVYKAEKVDGHRVQRIKIIYNCIGEFTLPDAAEYEKTA